MVRFIAGIVGAVIFAGGAAAAAEPPCPPIVLSTGSAATAIYVRCPLQSVGVTPPDCVPCPGTANLLRSAGAAEAFCRLEFGGYGGAPAFVVVKAERDKHGKCVPVGAVPLRRATLTVIEARQAPPAQAAPHTAGPAAGAPVAAPRMTEPRFALPRIMQGGERPTASSASHGGQITH